jgi:hypothetical protein
MKIFRSFSLYVLLFTIGSELYGQAPVFAVMGPNTKWNQDFNGMTTIRVYWENPGAGNMTQREWVKQAILQSWSRVANVNFVGWGQYDNSGSGIRIYIDDNAVPHTSALGPQISGVYQGMVLNFNFLGKFICPPGRTKEYCIKAMAVHEFGHVLGIAHGNNKPDCACAQFTEGYGGGNTGAYYATPCEVKSVMNYCDQVLSNNGQLSKYDIDGIQAVYGARKEMLDNGMNTGYSSITDELGPNQIWENLYLTIGDQQFIFNINEGNKAEIKTFKISSSGRYNFTISSLSLYKDNKTYQASGSGTIDFDKTKNYTIEIQVSNNNIANLTLVLKDITTQHKAVSAKPAGNDSRVGGIAPSKHLDFMRNGQRPTHLLLLDNVKNEKFYIYADGVIQVYNIPNKTLGICGQKKAPHYKSGNGIDWAWSFDRNIGNNQTQYYTISTDGEVWAMATDGQLRRYGIVTGLDF